MICENGQSMKIPDPILHRIYNYKKIIKFILLILVYTF